MADEIALLRTGVDAWRDRALKAEARLAEARGLVRETYHDVGTCYENAIAARESLMCDHYSDLIARIDAFLAADSASAVQSERCCLDYPRCDCNSPPEPDNAPTLQPCGHPWKAQHDFKCILCSSPGDATSAQLAEEQRFLHDAAALIQRIMARLADLLDDDQFNEIDGMVRDAQAMCQEDLPNAEIVALRVKLYNVERDLEDSEADNERLRRELAEARAANESLSQSLNNLTVARPAVDEVMARELAEARDGLTRLLRDGIKDAPCPTPTQWRQLQDFATGYLAALENEGL